MGSGCSAGSGAGLSQHAVSAEWMEWEPSTPAVGCRGYKPPSSLLKPLTAQVSNAAQTSFKV